MGSHRLPMIFQCHDMIVCSVYSSRVLDDTISHGRGTVFKQIAYAQTDRLFAQAHHRSIGPDI